MNINIPIEIEVRAKASSHYTEELIEARLAALEGLSDSSTDREREYLLTLLTEMRMRQHDKPPQH